MKLSIIIPVYNVEQYLQSCVQSVITQTYQDLQVVLVNDGSTDSSGILCDQLAQQDSRIQVVHKENGGLSDARNAGLMVATGDYVAFLDSDDVYLLNDGLEQLMALAQAEQPDVLLFQAVDVYPHHQTVRKAYDVEYMAIHSGAEVFAPSNGPPGGDQSKNMAAWSALRHCRKSSGPVPPALPAAALMRRCPERNFWQKKSGICPRRG